MSEFSKPVFFGENEFEALQGGSDPADVHAVAHDTALALVSRARSAQDTAMIERLVTYTDTHGIEPLADLWSHSSPKSLPGILWRVYLLRTFIRQHAELVSHLFQLGVLADATIHPVVAGVESPSGPQEVMVTADEILRGVFQDDFAVALERAASFCMIASAGATFRADEVESVSPETASELTTKALRLSDMGRVFLAGAQLWRIDALD